MQAWTNTVSLSGLNIASSKYPSIALVITQKAAEDDDACLRSGASLALEPE